MADEEEVEMQPRVAETTETDTGNGPTPGEAENNNGAPNGNTNNSSSEEPHTDMFSAQGRNNQSHVSFNIQNADAASESGESFDEGEPDKQKASSMARRPSGTFNYGDRRGSGFERHKTMAEMQNRTEGGEQLGRLRRDTAVPLDFVIANVKHQLDAGDLYRDLIFFLPFLIAFVFFFLYGREIESNFYVLKGIRDQVMVTEFPNVEFQVEMFREQVLNEKRLWIERDKRYMDIGNSGDWGDWLVDVMINTIWDRRNPDAHYDMLAPIGQNYHLGAMRVRAIRMTPDSCDIYSQIYPENTSNFPRTCYKKHDRKKEDKNVRCNLTNPVTGGQMINYKSCDDIPGIVISAVEGVYHCGGHMVEIPFNYSYNEALAIANELKGDNANNEECGLVDNWGTRFVSVEYFVYTPQTDTFHGIKMYSEILPGGWWYNQFMMRSFQVWTSRRANQTVFEFFFLIYVLYWWVRFFYEMVQSIRKGPGCLKFFTEFWNLLELTNLVTFIVVFILRWVWMSDSQSAENLKFPYTMEYPDNLDRLMGLFNSQVYANAINTILTFLKLLKYVRLNARLSVLTRTIAMCQQSIIGVLVLFVFVIIGYGITAWTLFGINIEGFRNLGVAMSTLVRMLVGEIDYEAMRRENRFLAGVFFWSFIILALFLLLNFLIAIISEAFAKISGKAYAQPFDEVLLRWYQHMKALLSPTNLKRWCNGIKTGNSDKKLMRRALISLEEAKVREEEALREQREEEKLALRAQATESGVFGSGVYEEYIFEDEIEVMMMRADWRKWLEPEVYEMLGDFFFDYQWDDIMNDYDDARKSAEEVGKRHMMETVQHGVEKVVGDELKKVDQLDELLTSLEKEVASIIGAVQNQ